MAEISHFFPLSIYKASLGLEPSYREQMIARIVEDAKKSGYDRAEQYAWTGDVSGFEFLHAREAFEPLFRAMAQHIEAYREAFQLKADVLDFYFTRSWATVSSTSQLINLHQHMQSHISAVYYLKTPQGAGNFVLEPFTRDNPNEFIPGLLHKENFLDKTITPSLLLSPGASITVEEDMLLLFPSKTRHGTEKSTSSEERISIAADIVAVLRESHGREYFLPPLDMWRKFG